MQVSRNLPGWTKFIVPFKYHANDLVNNAWAWGKKVREKLNKWQKITIINLSPVTSWAINLYMCFYKLFSVQTLHLVAWVLQHNHHELLIWSNHNFVLVWTNANEGDVFFWMETFHSSSCFCVELRDERAVLNCCILVHSGADGHALLIDDDYAEYSHVRIDPV